jgi:hypothetical protein
MKKLLALSVNVEEMISDYVARRVLAIPTAMPHGRIEGTSKNSAGATQANQIRCCGMIGRAGECRGAAGLLRSRQASRGD